MMAGGGKIIRKSPRKQVTGRRFRAKLTRMAKESRRYWLTFSAQKARRPLIWELSRKHELVFDIRSATVNADMGLMAIEFTGTADEIDAAVKWLRRRDVQVDPIY